MKQINHRHINRKFYIQRKWGSKVHPIAIAKFKGLDADGFLIFHDEQENERIEINTDWETDEGSMYMGKAYLFGTSRWIVFDILDQDHLVER